MDKKQTKTFDDIAVWGGHSRSHDMDYERSESGLIEDKNNWEKKLDNYSRGLITTKQFETINKIADEDDLDHIRGLSENRKRKSSKSKSKRKICKCK